MSSLASTWPAVTVWPTATSTSVSLPDDLKLSGTLTGTLMGPVALTVVWTLPTVAGVVWYVGAAAARLKGLPAT